MSRFDYSSFYGPITSLTDALRESPERFWEPRPEELA
jgi:hypothetical protein